MKIKLLLSLKRGKTLALHIYFLGCCMLPFSCTKNHEDKLPILGERRIEDNDTIYHTIPPFSFIDQDSMQVTNKTFDNQIYVADFFFTSCRTICPIMKTQLTRVYERVKDMNDVALLSHTIDPDRDTVKVLHKYAQSIGAKTDKWHFVTGVKDSIYKVAQTGYFATAMESNSTPEGFIHSGSFLLIDKDRRIRGKYNGTNKEEVSRLMSDIEKLHNEYR